MQKSKTELHLVVFGSPLSTRESIFNDHQVILKRIEATYDVNFLFPEELDKEAPKGATMVFVGSGGVEEMVKANIDRLPPYVMLIADGLKNSLAASLEILSWMRLEGRQGRVVHGDTDFMMEGIADYMTGYEALGKLKGTRVGVIGHPSGWLIASGVDYADVHRSWGTELIDLPLEEVVSDYRCITDDEVKDDTEDFVRHASGMKEPSVADVVKAMRLCRALQKMVDRYKLSAFTLNCFDLIPPTGTTGCVALAMLNDRGIPAGCEGDIQTLLTMLAVQAATGEVAFMANPSMITNNARHEMIFAHCTIAPCMTDSYTIRTHYESQSGVALEGTMSPGSYTVVKGGGRRMERFFVSNAELLECTANPNMCRTQLHLRLQEPLDYFLHRSIGNHHVIVKGNCSNLLTSVFTMLGAKKD
jgi:L-fucose isomerase-like protein